MNKQSEIQHPISKIVIVGAGPAGASLAIRLARADFRVVLIEREKFPRHKLCGEFISPECLVHFRDLGVLDKMLAAGGENVAETVFYAENGRSVNVPSRWLGGRAALSLSRAEMDFRLLEKAKEAGAEVFEETQVVGLLAETDVVSGVKARDKNGEIREFTADLTIDATGRAGVLAKLAGKFRVRQIPNPKSQIPNRLVGFKTHLENVRMEKGRCEIYSFRGGYGGLTYVENDLANLCFLIKADLVREIGQTNLLLKKVIFQNCRAFETLKDARPVYDWLAVSVDSFGIKNLHPAKRLLTVGDAAAFIDPFTGSGMLMALESAEILAGAISDNIFLFDKVSALYDKLYKQRFQRRWRICSLIRRAAFIPSLAGMVISALSLSSTVREVLARATRQNLSESKKHP